MRLNDLKGKTVGMCVSGGLDSKTITKKLVEEGVSVICFTADLAQPDEPDIQNIPKKMAPCGAETVVVDLKNQMAAGCFEVIKASASYDGGYWNTTAMARAVTVRGLITAMKARGVNVLGVAPGIMIKPDLKQRILDPRSDQDRAARDSVIESITTQVQLGRVCLPEEVANMVAYLASEAADYMCGQTIDVAGGQWMN